MALADRLRKLDRQVLRGAYPLQTSDETTDQWLARLAKNRSALLAAMASALLETRARVEELEKRLAQRDV